VHGFDVYFARRPEFPANSLQGWRRWCVIAYVEKSGGVMISCHNRSVAEAAFGPGGLMNVFPELPQINGRTWGGREAVGGSPRDSIFPVELLPQVLATAEASLILSKGEEESA
jgi:hypothetical protein